MSLDQIVRDAVEPLVAKASTTMARAVAQMVADALETELTNARGRKARIGRARGRREITRWVADRRARRVPLFVIAATGLKTKKQVVAKYGENAAFEKGKPPPKAK